MHFAKTPIKQSSCGIGQPRHSANNLEFKYIRLLTIRIRHEPWRKTPFSRLTVQLLMIVVPIDDDPIVLDGHETLILRGLHSSSL